MHPDGCDGGGCIGKDRGKGRGRRKKKRIGEEKACDNDLLLERGTTVYG